MSPELSDDYSENVRLSPEYFRRAVSKDVDPGPLESVDERVLVTGSGSSYSMALLLSDLLRRRGTSARTVYPYELTRHERLDDALVVGVSQSGETTDVVDAVDRAHDAGCSTVGITAVGDSSLSDCVDHALVFEPPGEYLLSRACGVMSCLGLLLQLYHALGATAPDGWPSAAVDRVVTTTESQLTAGDIQVADEYVFLAGGAVGAMATESALSVQEATFLHANAYDVKNFAHGKAFRYTGSEDATFVLLEAADDDAAVFDAAESLLSEFGYDPIRVRSAFDQPWAAADTLAWSLAFSARLNDAVGLDLAAPPGMEAVWTLLESHTSPEN